MRRLYIFLHGWPAALIVVLLLASIVVLSGTIMAGDIVDHPDKLKFKELNYQPPKPGDFRHQLKCGATAYVAENPEAPTFDMTILIRTGQIYEPVEKAGLAKMTIDEGLGLLKKILRQPTFDQAAIDKYRADILSEMEQRNSSTASIESREWMFLLYGNHPCTTPYRRTEHSINSITRDDMLAFHKKYFFPGNFIFAISGDFKTDDILTKLDNMFGGWPDQPLDLPVVTDQIPDPKPGVYMIKKNDVNQSRIRVGHIGVKRDIPDEYALEVMNYILGGGGFSSRIMRRVRSDEGLAYNAGSAFDRPVLYPGTFRAWFQTKHETGAFGTSLIVDEINRIRTEKCDEEAVDNAKASFVSNIVNPFSSKKAIVNTFAEDDYTGRPDDYWQNYRKNVEAVTPESILAVAQKYLHPEKLVFLVVGDPEAVQNGSDKHNERFSDFGEITILPLRDPLTLEMK